MKTPTPRSIRRLLAPAVLSAALFSSHTALAATLTWNGSGVNTNTGSTWDTLGNYTGAASFSSSNDLDFSQINSIGPVTLSAASSGTIAAQSLYFSTAASTITTPESITLNGNGTAGQTVLSLSKNIYIPSPTSSVVTLGGDLTLNFSNGTHTVNYQQNNNITVMPSVLPVLVIASKITGGGAATNFTGAYSTLGLSATGSAIATAPAVVLSNNANTVDTTYSVGGLLSYTSINNTGTAAGASSLGISNLSAGSIGFSNGGRFSYVGSGNQSTNRGISYGGANTINNYATTPSTLTFTGVFSGSATSAGTMTFGVSSGNTITVNSVIHNSTGTGTPAWGVAKGAGAAYYDANGVFRAGDGGGTLILLGANTYTGATVISSGTLQVGDGTTGNLINSGGTYSALTFNSGGGAFVVNEASGVSQNMGALSFSSGDGTVQSINNGGNSYLTFASIAARTKGATGNFVITNGTNGTTNKIVLTGQATGAALGAGYFFAGNSSSATFAYNDASGYVRGINYGTDANTQNNTTGAAFTASNNVKVSTTNVTGQATQTISTLQIADTSTVGLAASGTLTVGGILKSGGNASTISGGSITAGGANDLVIRVDQASDMLTLSSNITSTTGGLTKTGLGTLKLTGTNSSAGATYLNAGTLQIQAANNLSNGYAINLGAATLESLGGTYSVANTVNMYGSGTVQVDAGTLTLAGGMSIAYSGINNLTVSGSGNTTLSGIISGAGAGINKIGSGTLTINNAANTYSGPTTVNGGQLVVNGALSVDTKVAVNSGATLAGSGTVNGVTAITSGTINGSGLKLGGATTLKGTSALAGTITASSISVSEGTTSLTGTTTASSGLTVSLGATFNNGGKVTGNVTVNGLLNGTGTVDGALVIKGGGELAPGNSPGTQTITGDLTVESGAKVSIQLDSLNNYDQLVVGGAVSLAGTLDLAIGSVSDGDLFTIILNNGSSAISGSFSSVTLSGSSVTLSAQNTFTIENITYGLSYTGGNGNDLTLSVEVVPEPSTWAMIVGGVGMLAFGQRMRRRVSGSAQ